MKIYSASRARAHLSEVLDAAESGRTVVIERGRQRFRIAVEARPRREPRRKPSVEILDPAVLAGQWTWSWGGGGVRFEPRSRRR